MQYQTIALNISSEQFLIGASKQWENLEFEHASTIIRVNDLLADAAVTLDTIVNIRKDGVQSTTPQGPTVRDMATQTFQVVAMVF
jgi:hypothetical protein